ncbi:uncharacterized protein PG998_008864 [Apiospora kogelbergensis]|uniref:uncharacterized protein n=1 Tax=Apiospora kogelbergensis TaxID=1337665 RepID=UPI00313064D7
MLSHLRFHRRGPSNPTSPNPDNAAWDAASHQPAQLVSDDSSVPAPDIRPRSATSVPQSQSQARPQSPPFTSPPPPPQPQQAPPPPPPSQAPPSLPPIARVASVDTEYSASEYSIYTGDPEPLPREEPRQPARSPYSETTGFLGGLKYRREQDAAAAAAATSPRAGPSERSPSYSLDNRNSSSRPNIASIVTSPPALAKQPLKSNNLGSSFVSPTDLQHSSNTGKRPPGTRMMTEPPMLSQTPAQDPPKGRKSLPFLKNPMSTLLMRRKTSQNIPDLSLSLLDGRGGTSYEPIRGTKVHDFSAPRPKRPVSSSVSPMPPTEQTVPEALPPTKDDPLPPQRAAPPVPPKDAREQSGRSSASLRSRRTLSVDGAAVVQGESISNPVSASASRRITLMDPQVRRNSSIPSSISTLSRNMSGMSNKEVLSALPKHMKSTSSRFSFDMMGAANAEKLLEERHRQREQDKQPEIPAHRDSRYDDFDDDPFEYDDMFDDDGLEERIPGVNADYDEEEEDIYEEPISEYDPDNDQENFAGFVFQRSNPHSTLQSPQDAMMATTPRDTEGNIIGFAMTQGTPDANRLSQLSLQDPQLSQPHSPVSQALRSGDSPTGLGIQGLDAAIHDSDQSSPQQNQPKDTALPAHLNPDDELYFGGAGLEGEGDGIAIDEALFDLEDTDQYGRPLAGVFAQALARRRAAEEEEEAKKRESDDVTSRLSGATAITQSTAHTSMSVVPNQKPMPVDTQPDQDKSSLDGLEQPEQPKPTEPGCDTAETDNMAAYQAALAAAAYKAAASGKFRRDSDPPLPTDVTITSPTTSGSDQSNANIDSFDDYEFDDGFDDGYDDGFGNGLDDYELDDDAIIAEANASALAHDSDGWYGQEFGFYATPAQPIPLRNTNAGSDPNPFYGGFFGSNHGLARSKSGHLISREPNLTPITERSEYSNRNSIMSLMSPNSTAGRELSSLQSPGLAQLAMMADDDNMSLSALLQLRSKAWAPWSPEGREPIGNDMYGRKNSAFSLWSQSAESGAASGSGSPTLTMSIPTFPNNSVPPLPPNAAAVGNPNNPAGSAPSAIPAPLFSPPPIPMTFPPVLEDEEVDDGVETDDTASAVLQPSPVLTSSADMSWASPTFGVPSQTRPGMGHRHKGSADSVSYRQEQDGGESRWVVERRRTAESGEIEVLEREVVEGGRI